MVPSPGCLLTAPAAREYDPSLLNLDHDAAASGKTGPLQPSPLEAQQRNRPAAVIHGAHGEPPVVNWIGIRFRPGSCRDFNRRNGLAAVEGYYFLRQREKHFLFLSGHRVLLALDLRLQAPGRFMFSPKREKIRGPTPFFW